MKKIEKNELNKQSSNLIIMISCISVLMLIIYFTVSFSGNSKATYSADATCTCPSGYVLEGTKCRQRKNATCSNYSCATGYVAATEGKCRARQNAICSQYSCESGWTKETNNTCTYMRAVPEAYWDDDTYCERGNLGDRVEGGKYCLATKNAYCSNYTCSNTSTWYVEGIYCYYNTTVDATCTSYACLDDWDLIDIKYCLAPNTIDATCTSPSSSSSSSSASNSSSSASSSKPSSSSSKPSSSSSKSSASSSKSSASSAPSSSQSSGLLPNGCPTEYPYLHNERRCLFKAWTPTSSATEYSLSKYCCNSEGACYASSAGEFNYSDTYDCGSGGGPSNFCSDPYEVYHGENLCDPTTGEVVIEGGYCCDDNDEDERMCEDAQSFKYSDYVLCSGASSSSKSSSSSGKSSSSKISSVSSNISSSGNGGGNVQDNPRTGTTAIIFAWIVGIISIGYSFWYFKRTGSIGE